MSSEIVIPDELCAHVERYWGARGRQWTHTLPRAIRKICAVWSLRLGGTLAGASTAFVATVTRADGTDAVLKVAFPDIVGEADALAVYRGAGVVALYRHDTRRCALLLERCDPGTTLGSLDDPQAIVSVACTLMQRLWRAALPTAIPMAIPTLSDHCARLAANSGAILAQIEAQLLCDDHRHDLDAATRALAHEGLDLLHSLAADATQELLLHGDLHPGNIRRSTREPWLVIDPKPLRGDPAYEPIPLLIETPTDNGAPLSADELVTRIATVARRCDLSPLRIASWGLARRIDWALFCYGQHDHAATARRFAEARWFSAARLRYAND